MYMSLGIHLNLDGYINNVMERLYGTSFLGTNFATVLGES